MVAQVDFCLSLIDTRQLINTRQLKIGTHQRLQLSGPNTQLGQRNCVMIDNLKIHIFGYSKAHFSSTSEGNMNDSRLC